MVPVYLVSEKVKENEVKRAVTTPRYNVDRNVAGIGSKNNWIQKLGQAASGKLVNSARALLPCSCLQNILSGITWVTCSWLGIDKRNKKEKKSALHFGIIAIAY